MGADSYLSAVAAAEWLSRPLSEGDLEQLTKYHELLATEAAAAGGIGPSETSRLWSRHIADSLLFGVALDRSSDCLDIGSGVGLPGIPLAIHWPDVSFVLLDRSGRRCDLMRRAIGVLGLRNCVVAETDVSNLDDGFGAIVSRAAIPPSAMVIHVKHLLNRKGTAVLGLSRTGNSSNPLKDQPQIETDVIAVPAEVLDTDVNLLRIVAT
ncbi:MAG: hypothetical protein GY926_02665 [bacterium]|nr:hypothetical protein [bacterium]